MRHCATKKFPSEILKKLRYTSDINENKYHLKKINVEVYYQTEFSTMLQYVFINVKTNRYYRFIYITRNKKEYQEDIGFYGENGNNATEWYCEEVKPVEVSIIQYQLAIKEYPLNIKEVYHGRK